MKAIRMVFLCLLACAIAAAAGCGQGKDADDGYLVFYLNKESTKISPRPYEPEADESDTDAMVGELLARLSSDSGDVEYKQPIPEDVKVLDYTLEEALLTVYFDGGYGRIDRVEEVLLRAAVVRTLIQVDGVDYLTFYVGDAPLSDSNGNPIGVMTADSFIENPGEQINSIETAELTLYFANQKGNKLLPEVREVHYSSNISMEKLVMEHLLEGPKDRHMQSAIPEGTKLMNVSVSEGVCYVSLDENFLNQNYNIEEAVVIYSIVNSLSELPNINKVQISVKGDTSISYRDAFPLDGLYERNLDYLEE